MRAVFVKQATDAHALGEDLLHGLRLVQAQDGIERSRRGLPQPGAVPGAQVSRQCRQPCLAPERRRLGHAGTVRCKCSHQFQRLPSKEEKKFTRHPNRLGLVS